MNFGIAVKSFIVNDKNELLLIKRNCKDQHKPGVWEVPGGRLEPGEDPFEGLKRETKEETGLEISVHNPLHVHHFIRDDGQKITMITFLCRTVSENVALSGEHSEYRWVSLNEAHEIICPNFIQDLNTLNNRVLS